MYRLCRHIKPNGIKCKSPACGSSAYCFYHGALSRARNPSVSDYKLPVTLSSLENNSGIQIALQQVLDAFGCARIDASKARVFLRGLEIATRLAPKPVSEDTPEPVREITCDHEGNPLGLEQNACEYPQDCPECKQQNSCTKFFLERMKKEGSAPQAEFDEESDEVFD